MTRPRLSRSLKASEFLRWYWLKSELQIFCRKLEVSTSGVKTDLQKRIVAVLNGRRVPRAVKGIERGGSMPERFTPKTVIGSGWRCTKSLREHFVTVHGSGFVFNAALRDFLASGKGKTLAAASAVYESTRGKPARSISRQFEYNRHIREFHAHNPGATHREAVEAWWAKRSKRGC